jgi:hypothetical protein
VTHPLDGWQFIYTERFNLDRWQGANMFTLISMLYEDKTKNKDAIVSKLSQSPFKERLLEVFNSLNPDSVYYSRLKNALQLIGTIK